MRWLAGRLGFDRQVSLPSEKPLRPDDYEGRDVSVCN
jgi:hypothetical protein